MTSSSVGANTLKQRFELIMDKIDSLSLRERALVLLSTLAIVYLVWDVAIFNRLASAKSKVDVDVASLEQGISTMSQEEAALLSALNADPDRDLKQQIDGLQRGISNLEGSLTALSLGLVPVEKMPEILQDVLKRTGSLQLVRLETLPVEELQLTIAPELLNKGETASAGVYKHSAALTVRGGYMDLIRYLQALESMNWRFYWEELRFDQSSYPNAVITLKVYTLTTDEGLFGV